mgnify:FL=1
MDLSLLEPREILNRRNNCIRILESKFSLYVSLFGQDVVIGKQFFGSQLVAGKEEELNEWFNLFSRYNDRILIDGLPDVTNQEKIKEVTEKYISWSIKFANAKPFSGTVTNEFTNEHSVVSNCQQSNITTMISSEVLSTKQFDPVTSETKTFPVLIQTKAESSKVQVVEKDPVIISYSEVSEPDDSLVNDNSLVNDDVQITVSEPDGQSKECIQSYDDSTDASSDQLVAIHKTQDKGSRVKTQDKDSRVKTSLNLRDIVHFKSEAKRILIVNFYSDFMVKLARVFASVLINIINFWEILQRSKVKHSHLHVHCPSRGENVMNWIRINPIS